MKKIFYVLFLVAILCGCAEEVKKIEENLIPKEDVDGWILIGDKEGCKLYKKWSDGYLVYWSICKATGGPATSSVGAH